MTAPRARRGRGRGCSSPFSSCFLGCAQPSFVAVVGTRQPHDLVQVFADVIDELAPDRISEDPPPGEQAADHVAVRRRGGRRTGLERVEHALFIGFVGVHRPHQPRRGLRLGNVQVQELQVRVEDQLLEFRGLLDAGTIVAKEPAELGSAAQQHQVDRGGRVGVGDRAVKVGAGPRVKCAEVLHETVVDLVHNAPLLTLSPGMTGRMLGLGDGGETGDQRAGEKTTNGVVCEHAGIIGDTDGRPPWRPDDRIVIWDGRESAMRGAMKVLVVEDEPMIASFVEKGLREAGFVVSVADNGDDGYALARNEVFDALVLDIMLPGRDGLSILRNLREVGSPLPVLVLTARDGLQEKIEGAGPRRRRLPDQAVLHRRAGRTSARRAAAAKRPALEHAARRTRSRRPADPNRALRGTEEVDLTAREFALLEYLMRRPGRVLTRMQILEQVWHYDFDPKTNLVDVYVRRVRKKLGDGGGAMIETVRGVVGYRFLEEGR